MHILDIDIIYRLAVSAASAGGWVRESDLGNLESSPTMPNRGFGLPLVLYPTAAFSTESLNQGT